jgi:O-antigen/teichoic acid export membrane protein
MAAIYEEPDLLILLPIGALNVLVAGFGSTSVFTLRRKLQLGRILGMELIAQLVGLAVVIPWAYFFPSVWAIVASGLVNALVKTVLSHTWIKVGYRNRFQWDPEAKAAILNFGKWIFGSSALFFLSRQGDRLLLGRFLGVATLGIYTIAVFLSEALGAVASKITHGVFYPIFSQVRREEPERLQEVYYKTRLRLDALSMLPLGLVAVLGDWVVHILYDARYADAGWMLQALTIRVAMGCVLIPCETCLFSMGYTRYGFFQNIGRSSWILIGVPVGYYAWGIEGVVWVTALSEVPVIFTLWPPFYKLGLLKLSRELLAWAIFAVGAALGLGVSWVLGLVWPSHP